MCTDVERQLLQVRGWRGNADSALHDVLAVAVLHLLVLLLHARQRLRFVGHGVKLGSTIAEIQFFK